MEPGIAPHEARQRYRFSAKGSASAGLTLIELTIFLVLMGILASFVIPRISMVTEINLRRSARTLGETLLEVSALATNLSTPFAVQYDLDKQKYCYKMMRQDPVSGKWQVLFTDEKTEEMGADPYAKQKCIELGEGVYFKGIETLVGTETLYEKGQIPQYFSPRNITSPPLLIHLGDRKGRFYTIVLNRYGGNPDIRQGKLEYKDYLKELLD